MYIDYNNLLYNIKLIIVIMSIEIGRTINEATDWISEIPIVSSIIQNPIYTALLITALFVVIILTFYYTSGFHKIMKCTLYFFLIILGIMYVHNYSIIKHTTATLGRQDVKNVFAAIQQNKITGGKAMPIDYRYVNKLPDNLNPSSDRIIDNISNYNLNPQTSHLSNLTAPNLNSSNLTTANANSSNLLTTPNLTTPNLTTPNLTTPNLTTYNVQDKLNVIDIIPNLNIT